MANPAYNLELELDPATITTMDTIVLTGLDFSMKPEKVRYELDKGFIKPFTEIKVKHTIKSLAIMVYNQERATAFYHNNVCDVCNPLAYFLCAIHRQQPPQPKKHSRPNSNSSQFSGSSTTNISACKKKCALPKLATGSMLQLGHWDGLYYALVAEIWQLHADLQARYGFGCENGTEPIHHYGEDGHTNRPMTAIGLASLLETAWYQLMDNRLVATLDDAVRMRRFHEQRAKHMAEPSDPNARSPIIYGLMDINSLDPNTIVSLLWDKYRPEIDQACLEDFEDESMLSTYSAKQYASQIEESALYDTPLPSASLCKCHRTCVCQLKCDNTMEGCTCSHAHVYDILDKDGLTGKVPTKYVKVDTKSTDHSHEVVTGAMAKLRMDATAAQDETFATAPRKTSDGIKTPDIYSMNITRKRTNTNNSELAYVPGSKRGVKDAYPLDFYGRISGQRYPTVPSPTTTPVFERTSEDNGSYFAGGEKALSRKPVPAAMQTFAAPKPQDSGKNEVQASTWPTTPTYTKGQVVYPAIPVSQSTLTQSFPAQGARNPRDATLDNSNKHTKKDSKLSRDPAEDYLSLLSEHPSAMDYTEKHTSPVEPFPSLSRAGTSSPSKKKTSPTSFDLPRKSTDPPVGFKTLQTNTKLNKPIPALPEPDFIAPKPATKQRYVSAGGNIPLSERTEIHGPVYTTTPNSHGHAISPDDIEAYMNDPSWVRQHFGESAVGAVNSPPRLTTPPRGSDESGRETLDARDRTSSGASKREKFRRIFSRKNSQLEEGY